jgi:hypothetical protein
MAKAVDRNQGTLLVHDGYRDRFLPRDFDGPNPEVDENPGVSVNIVDRQLELDKVLAQLGKISQRTGFELAADHESNHRDELEERYDHLDAVVGRVHDKKQRMLKEVKPNFARAFGMEAMIDAGLMDKGEAQQMTRDEFNGFVRKYSDSPP